MYTRQTKKWVLLEAEKMGVSQAKIEEIIDSIPSFLNEMMTKEFSYEEKNYPSVSIRYWGTYYTNLQTKDKHYGKKGKVQDNGSE